MARSCIDKALRPLWYIVLAILIIDLTVTTIFIIVYGVRAFRYMNGTPESFQEEVFGSTDRFNPPPNSGRSAFVSHYGQSLLYGRSADGSLIPLQTTESGRRGPTFTHVVGRAGKAEEPYRPNKDNYDVNVYGYEILAKHAWYRKKFGEPDYTFTTTLCMIGIWIPLLLLMIWFLLRDTVSEDMIYPWFGYISRIVLLVARYIVVNSTWQDEYLPWFYIMTILSVIECILILFVVAIPMYKASLLDSVDPPVYDWDGNLVQGRERTESGYSSEGRQSRTGSVAGESTPLVRVETPVRSRGSSQSLHPETPRSSKSRGRRGDRRGQTGDQEPLVQP